MPLSMNCCIETKVSWSVIGRISLVGSSDCQSILLFRMRLSSSRLSTYPVDSFSRNLSICASGRG